MNHTTQMFAFRSETPPSPEHAHLMVAGIDINGVIYASGDIHHNGERLALLMAWHDGVAAIEQGGHLYFPVDWLEAETRAEPCQSDTEEDARRAATLVTLDKIRSAVRAAVRSTKAEDQRSAPTDPSAQ